MPVRLISSVRGIGVADSVSTSTPAFRCLICSLWLTPKRCSSSTTSRPRSLNCEVVRQEAVGADHDVDLPGPHALATTARAWAAVRNRDSTSTRTG